MQFAAYIPAVLRDSIKEFGDLYCCTLYQLVEQIKYLKYQKYLKYLKKLIIFMIYLAEGSNLFTPFWFFTPCYPLVECLCELLSAS